MSKSETNGTDAATVWEPQTGYLTNLYDRGETLLNNQPTTNTNVNTGRDMALDYAKSPALNNLINTTTGGFNKLMQPGQNPMLTNAINSAIRPITQNFKENVLSGVTDGAVSAGQHGGSRQGIAEGIAARGYLDTVGDVATNIAYQDYEGGQNRMLNAMNSAGEVMNLGMMPSEIMTNVGNAEKLDPWQQLQMQAGLIGGPAVLSGGGGGGKGGTASALAGIL